MRVLIAHIPYEHRGGEDVHVESLIRAYQEIGITPILYPESRTPSPKPLLDSLRSLLPLGTEPEIKEIWHHQKPDYIHLHNAFPLLGPRFFRWALQHSIPIAMTVHNHRFFCTNGLALRQGKVCKDCFSSPVAWRPLLRNCNKSWTKTGYHSIALTEMRVGGLYSRSIRQFIAPSPYIRDELVRWGIEKSRVTHILNPISMSSPAINSSQTNYDVFYAGRLSAEKGIEFLIKACELLPDLTFALAGSGPLQNRVQQAVNKFSNLKFLGTLSSSDVLSTLRHSKIAVLPSICNEILPTFVLEAFSQGRRCVVPRLDSTTWLAKDGLPGHLANTSDAQDLARAIREALASPTPTEKETETLQQRLSFQRFCADLKTFANQMK